VLGNIKVRNVIVNLGNKFIQSIREDCGGNVSLKLPAVKGDNVSIICSNYCTHLNIIRPIKYILLVFFILNNNGSQMLLP